MPMPTDEQLDLIPDKETTAKADPRPTRRPVRRVLPMKQAIRETIDMLDRGWNPYAGHVAPEVYERLGCDRPGDATWMARSEQRLCLGCSARCTLVRPTGFQELLPGLTDRVRPGRTMVVYGERVSVQEMLRWGRPLRTDEVAWILNLSPRQIQAMVEDGRLTAVSGLPLRILPDSVRSWLQPTATPGRSGRK